MRACQQQQGIRSHKLAEVKNEVKSEHVESAQHLQQLSQRRCLAHHFFGGSSVELINRTGSASGVLSNSWVGALQRVVSAARHSHLWRLNVTFAALLSTPSVKTKPSTRSYLRATGTTHAVQPSKRSQQDRRPSCAMFILLHTQGSLAPSKKLLSRRTLSNEKPLVLEKNQPAAEANDVHKNS